MDFDHPVNSSCQAGFITDYFTGELLGQIAHLTGNIRTQNSAEKINQFSAQTRFLSFRLKFIEDNDPAACLEHSEGFTEACSSIWNNAQNKI